MPNLATVRVFLKPGKETPIVHGHPWIFSGAVDKVEGEAPDEMGIAEVMAADGTWLGCGLWDGRSGLAVRIYIRNSNEPFDSESLRNRLRRAIQLRQRLLGSDEKTNAYRLVYSESDGLSGLIVDRYGEAFCVQVASRPLSLWLSEICEIVRSETGLDRFWVQAEADVAAREKWHVAGPDLQQPVAFRENGFQFEVIPTARQKTGFYLDQRENRLRVMRYCSGKRVLSAFCFTGAFEVYAASAGAASVVGVDRSETALAQARRHHELNGTSGIPSEYILGEVGTVLRRFRDAARSFDVVILDPPKFVVTKGQKEKGLRAYKDINLLGMKLLSPDGILATFSCSGQVSKEDLLRVLEWAATDANRRVRVLEVLSQPPDHPVLVGFPESEYLKGYICLVE